MELDVGLFKYYWHLVCHRRELLNDGDFIKFDTIVGDIVLFNDMGNIVAFDNKCPHRGANIYRDDLGNQPASCKYHGWTYRSGRVIVPDMHRFVGCAIETADLNKYRIDWCGDFIFIGVEPRFGLREQLGGVFEQLENISFNIDSCVDLSRYDYECYWAHAVENALEPYHISMVHPETLATLQLEEGENIFDGPNSIWYAPVGNMQVKNKLMKLKNLFNIDYQYEGYISIYIFPFTMISSTYGYSYSLQNFFPAKDGKGTTKFTSRLLTSNVKNERASRMLSSFFESTVEVNKKVFDEDHEICRSLPRDSWSAEPLKFFSELESKIIHFRQTCRDAEGFLQN
jgi:phenylpropionate dioxygenase-like ring-hydroxylating dioxygenase large terminal subunit